MQIFVWSRTPLFIFLSLALSISIFAQAQTGELKLRVTGINAGETYTFEDINGQVLTFTGPLTRTLGTFPVGMVHRFIQKSGPRWCRVLDASGSMIVQGIEVDINCLVPARARLTLMVTGIGTGEKFGFEDVGGQKIELPRSMNFNFAINVGNNYSVRQTSGPRQCRLTNPAGTMTLMGYRLPIDCSAISAPGGPTNPPPTTGNPVITFLDFDLISRSIDQKSFGTFYGSVTPSIGGIDETGVKEGQFVAYMTSWNIDPKHGGKARQIVWFNRGNGQVAIASQTPDGLGGDKDSYEPSIDNKGYTVAFESIATNLLPGDANGVSDVFVWTLMDNTVRWVSQGANAASMEPVLSGDGNYVAFTSNADNLTPGVTGKSAPNVYLRNLRSGEITLISKDPKTNKAVSGSRPSITEDGSRVAFYSYSDKLVDGDTNRLWDIFVWTRGNPKLKRVSMTSGGGERDQGTESASRVVRPTISGDGKYVVFSTTAKTIMNDPVDTFQDVFVVEIDTGRVIRASATSSGVGGNGDSPVEQGGKIAISHDGTWVLFPTMAKNLGGNMILKNIRTGEIHAFGEAGRNLSGSPALSRNGKCVAFPAGIEMDKRFKSTGVFASCMKED